MPAPTIPPISAIKRTHTGGPRTALQSHVSFFDQDSDGVIWLTDTYYGFRSLKFGVVLSVLAALLLHFWFSYFTSKTWFPDLLGRINVEYIHRGKHGSDSESYTRLGDFDEMRFDYIFKHNTEYPHTRMSFLEGVQMVRGNRSPLDLFGWIVSSFEWLIVYILLWPEDGYVAKKDIHDIFDGSLFYRISGRPNPEGKDWKAN